MYIGKRELEALVDQDAGHIREAEQGVVGEDHIVPHGARMQRCLVRHRRESLGPKKLGDPVPLPLP